MIYVNMKGEKQMIYKNIAFKVAPFSYDLAFEDRITLVGGDSAVYNQLLNLIIGNISQERWLIFVSSPKMV